MNVKNMLKTSKESKHSIISKRMLKNNHLFDWQYIKILDFEPNYYKRIVSEMT